MNSLKEKGVEAELIANRDDTSDAILWHIKNNCPKDTQPILHLVINGSPQSQKIYTGGAFTSNDLCKFKQDFPGGKTVTTFFEITKPGPLQERYKEYCKAADAVVLCADHDLEVAQKNMGRDVAFAVSNKPHKVIPIPPTINIKPKKLQEREANILHFGVIRIFKGVDEAVNMAKFLHKKGSTRKVILTGGASDEIFGSMGALKYALCVSFPEHNNELNRHNTVKELLEYYNNTLRSLTPAINIELHFNVPENELGEIFSKCRYSIFNYPRNKGIAPRLSGISNSLAYGLKVYGASGDYTPEEIKQGGEFEKAVHLVDFSRGDAAFEQILHDMNKLDRDQNYQSETSACIENYVKHMKMSMEEVRDAQIALYQQLIGRALSTSPAPFTFKLVGNSSSTQTAAH